MSIPILLNAYHSKNRRKVYEVYFYCMIICTVKKNDTSSEYLVNPLLKWLFIPASGKRADKCGDHRISVRKLQYLLLDIKPHLVAPGTPV